MASGRCFRIGPVTASGFTFRGSLGKESIGHTAFWEYLKAVRGALSDYQCEILTCVTEDDDAFAKMKFSGLHTGDFRGYSPTGKAVEWVGAAHFVFRGPKIKSLWVLGDLWSLEENLRKNNEQNQPVYLPTLRSAVEGAHDD